MGIVMSSFYQMTFCEEEKYQSFGVAYAHPDVDLFLLPKSGVRIDYWESIKLELRCGGYADYLSSDLGGRLCSEKLKDLIDQNISDNDDIQWLDVNVIDDQKCKKYYFLHFPKNIPVINKDRTIFAGNMVVKVVLDTQLVSHLSIFTLPDEVGRTLFVSEKLKKIISKNNITGVSFSKSACI